MQAILTIRLLLYISNTPANINIIQEACSAKNPDKNGHLLGLVPHTFFVRFFCRFRTCPISGIAWFYRMWGRVRVLANNVFLTGGGDFLIIGHCCRFVWGRVVWCGVGAVCISALLDGGCSGRIFLSK